MKTSTLATALALYGCTATSVLASPLEERALSCNSQSGNINTIKNSKGKPVDYCYLYLNGATKNSFPKLKASAVSSACKCITSSATAPKTQTVKTTVKSVSTKTQTKTIKQPKVSTTTKTVKGTEVFTTTKTVVLPKPSTVTKLVYTNTYTVRKECFATSVDWVTSTSTVLASSTATVTFNSPIPGWTSTVTAQGPTVTATIQTVCSSSASDAAVNETISSSDLASSAISSTGIVASSAMSSSIESSSTASSSAILSVPSSSDETSTATSSSDASSVTSSSATSAATSIRPATPTTQYKNVVNCVPSASPSSYYLKIDNTGYEVDGTVMLGSGSAESSESYYQPPSFDLGTPWQPEALTYDSNTGYLYNDTNTLQVDTAYHPGTIWFYPPGTYTNLQCNVTGEDFKIDCGAEWNGDWVQGIELGQFNSLDIWDMYLAGTAASGDRVTAVAANGTFNLIGAC